MKISKKAFEACLDKASKVIKSKNTLPVLDNFKLDCSNGILRVTASDLETTLIVSTPAAGGLNCLLPLEVKKVLSKIKEDFLEFTLTDDFTLTIQAGKKKFSYKTWSVEDYPQKPEFEVKETVFVNQKFIESVKRSLPFVGDDETRPVFSGVGVFINEDKMCLAASDQYAVNIEFTEYPLSNEFNISNPKLFTQIFDKETLKLNIGTKYHSFISENIEFHSRNIEGALPKFLSIFPTNYNGSFEVSTKEILNDFEVAKMFNDTKCRLLAGGGEIKLTSKDVDFEKEYTNTLHAECTGEPVEFGMYYKVFGKGIKSAGGDTVKLNYIDCTRIFVIQLESRLIGLMPASLQ